MVAWQKLFAAFLHFFMAFSFFTQIFKDLMFILFEYVSLTKSATICFEFFTCLAGVEWIFIALGTKIFATFIASYSIIRHA